MFAAVVVKNQFSVRELNDAQAKKVEGINPLAIPVSQIFLLPKTVLKAFLHLGQSKSPMVSSILFPLLSGRPAIFQDFLSRATSAPHFGHLAMHLPPS